MPEYNDFPKDELIAGAQQVLDNNPDAEVYFKATCPQCHERPAFSEPNICYESMVCCECGHEFPFTVGNYMVVVKP